MSEAVLAIDAGSAARRAAAIRAAPLSDFFGLACRINDSDALMTIYAAPEWAELSETGKCWVAALLRETLAQAAQTDGGRGPA